jgi:hypothetical protein
MCTPRVTWHTSVRYISSCYTRVDMGASIFFTALGQRGHVTMVRRTVYIPPLPRDLAVLLARIIAAVKNIDAPMLTRV